MAEALRSRCRISRHKKVPQIQDLGNFFYLLGLFDFVCVFREASLTGAVPNRIVAFFVSFCVAVKTVKQVDCN